MVRVISRISEQDMDRLAAASAREGFTLERDGVVLLTRTRSGWEIAATDETCRRLADHVPDLVEKAY